MRQMNNQKIPAEIKRPSQSYILVLSRNCPCSSWGCGNDALSKYRAEKGLKLPGGAWAHGVTVRSRTRPSLALLILHC